MSDSLENSINRGKEAQRVLSEPVLVEAFENLESLYTGEWKNSAFVEKDKRESAFLMFTALGDLKRQLVAFVTDGQMSEARLKKANI